MFDNQYEFQIFIFVVPLVFVLRKYYLVLNIFKLLTLETYTELQQTNTKFWPINVTERMNTCRTILSLKTLPILKNAQITDAGNLYSLQQSRPKHSANTRC